MGTVEKSGLDFSTVSTARHFHSQALDSGPFWLECRPWAQPEVQSLIFQNPRQMHIFPDSCGEPIFQVRINQVSPEAFEYGKRDLSFIHIHDSSTANNILDNCMVTSWMHTKLCNFDH